MGADIRLGPSFDEESRFHRQQLISWWNQSRLEATRVLLIGAGALGNEILKNLALVGVRRVVVVDMDRVENSNLARAVLFRAEDVGQPKAEVVCRRARELYPEMLVRPLVANCLHDLGLGVYRWAEVVMCGLDNREARVEANRVCQLLSRPWIDGAIERLDGVARVFLPDGGACYECTMNAADWQELEARRSCALLSREEMAGGKTPTTATSSSIVAGFQCQELLKLVHDQAVEGGSGVVVNGQVNDVYRVIYQRRQDCQAHESLDEVIDLGEGVASLTVGALLTRAQADLGAGAVLELAREIITHLECPSCGAHDAVFRPLGAVRIEDAPCPSCGASRFPALIHGLDATWEQPQMTLAELGLPPFDLVIARSSSAARGYVMGGDQRAVLGELARVPEESIGGVHESQ